mmetsp:Transcript_88144/g.128861  ORF Transcript_88144/g.128861 Transcript_88144/m.128861 type:complete len:200 (-) Transcript_88144:97-696(-)
MPQTHANPKYPVPTHHCIGVQMLPTPRHPTHTLTPLPHTYIHTSQTGCQPRPPHPLSSPLVPTLTPTPSSQTLQRCRAQPHIHTHTHTHTHTTCRTHVASHTLPTHPHHHPVFRRPVFGGNEGLRRTWKCVRVRRCSKTEPSDAEPTPAHDVAVTGCRQSTRPHACIPHAAAAAFTDFPLHFNPHTQQHIGSYATSNRF